MAKALEVLVLAGGEGRRFGKDKMLAIVDGRTSIERVVNEVNGIIVSANEERCKVYSSLTSRPCFVDPPLPCKGPSKGLYYLKKAFVAGDMPWFRYEVLERLEAFRRLYDADVAFPLHSGGFIESLVGVIREGLNVRERLEKLCKGEKGPSVMEVLTGGKTLLVGSSLLTRDPLVFAHVNTEEQLRGKIPKNALGEGVFVIDKKLKKGWIKL